MNESLSSFSPLPTGGGVLAASCPAPLLAAPPVELPVRGGGTVLVDADIAQQLAGLSICRRGRGYFAVRIDGHDQYLHHLVLPRVDGRQIDHKNRNRADNRRCNLRLVTGSVNQLNRDCRTGPSGFHGVHWLRRCRRWSVAFGWDWAVRRAGLYQSAVLGAMARDDLVVETTGLREGLNFPETVTSEGVPALLDQLAGGVFEAWFVKRSDGAIRHMVCRDFVPGPDDRPLAFDPAQRRLRPVWDVAAQAHRFLPLEGVLCLSCNGTRYRVLPSKTAWPPSTSTETLCARAAGWLTSPLSGCSSCPGGQSANAVGCPSS